LGYHESTIRACKPIAYRWGDVAPIQTSSGVTEPIEAQYDRMYRGTRAYAFRADT